MGIKKEGKTMGEIVYSKKSCSVYPLKLSQPLGAVYALLGFKGSISLLHGSQGCAAFAKTFLTRNFCENIPMQTTALSEISTIMGGDDNLHIALKNIIEKHNPELIGVITTGVSETRGDDVYGSLKKFKTSFPEYIRKNIFYVSTPDYEGSFHQGYKKAVLAIVRKFARKPIKKNKKQINVLVSYSLTAKDIDTIKDTVSTFGLKPVVLPDFSSSLDGETVGFSSLTAGGTTIKDVKKMSASVATISIGSSVRDAGEFLRENFSIPHYHFESLIGIENFDRFIRVMIRLTGKTPPENLKTWRDRLLDLMLDTHFYTNEKDVCIAGEIDHVGSVSRFLKKELGMNVKLAVVPTYDKVLKDIEAEKVVIGDLEDIITNTEQVDFLIGNTNIRHISSQLGLPYYRYGFPVFDELGYFLKGFAGYEGTFRFIADIANLLMREDEERSYHVPDYLKNRRDVI